MRIVSPGACHTFLQWYVLALSVCVCAYVCLFVCAVRAHVCVFVYVHGLFVCTYNNMCEYLCMHACIQCVNSLT